MGVKLWSLYLYQLCWEAESADSMSLVLCRQSKILERIEQLGSLSRSILKSMWVFNGILNNVIILEEIIFWILYKGRFFFFFFPRCRGTAGIRSCGRALGRWSLISHCHWEALADFLGGCDLVWHRDFPWMNPRECSYSVCLPGEHN